MVINSLDNQESTVNILPNSGPRAKTKVSVFLKLRGLGVTSPPPDEATYSKALGDPVPALVTLLGVALLFNAVATASGVAVGLAAR